MTVKYGCYIGFYVVDALDYAYDIVLVSTKRAHAVRNMLKICVIFGERHSFVFNAYKSKCFFLDDCPYTIRSVIQPM